MKPKIYAPSEHLFLLEVKFDGTRASLWSLCFPARAEVEGMEEEGSLFLDVDGEAFSKCLSSASLIRFRSKISPPFNEPPLPPRSLYINIFLYITAYLNLRRIEQEGEAWICTVRDGEQRREKEKTRVPFESEGGERNGSDAQLT